MTKLAPCFGSMPLSDWASCSSQWLWHLSWPDSIENRGS